MEKAQELAVQSWPIVASAADHARHLVVESSRDTLDRFSACMHRVDTDPCSDEEDSSEDEEREEQEVGSQNRTAQVILCAPATRWPQAFVPSNRASPTPLADPSWGPRPLPSSTTGPLYVTRGGVSQPMCVSSTLLFQSPRTPSTHSVVRVAAPVDSGFISRKAHS